MNSTDFNRRRFFIQTGLLALIPPIPALTAIAEEEETDNEEELVTPGEDLMREHGLLDRVLIVYEACLQTMNGTGELDPAVVHGGAEIVRTFIEDYHEKLEEQHVFPRLKKAGEQEDLIKTLLTQHEVGRRLTDNLLAHATAGGFRNDNERHVVAESMRRFIHMYRAHEAREETVLFPAFQKILTPHEYGALGEDFENIEHKHFGKDGFHEMVEKVAELEKQVGVHDLASFTPELPQS